MNQIKLNNRSIEYREEILKIIDHARRGHICSAFSIVEIVRVLYEDILRIDPNNPYWEERDRFILSKGHGCLTLYVALAKKGFIPKDEIYSFCEAESSMGGHPQYGKTAGVEASTGSLGHGLSIGIGIALNGKLEARDYRTYVLLGDGECNEGTIWEAAMSAAKHKLDSLVVLVDYNKMQCFGYTREVQDLEPFTDKWRSFGFAVREVNGHDMDTLRKLLLDTPFEVGKPNVIICHTVKGKGIPSIESNASWHHKSRIPSKVIQELFDELESIK
jgi:transketolase